MRLIANMPVQFLHDDLDFAKCNICAAANVYNRMKRFFEQRAPVHQRIFQCFCQRIVRTILSLGIPVAEQGASIAISQDGASIVEANVQRARSLKNGSNRTYTLGNRQIRSRECFMNSHARERDLRHPVIFETNNGISYGAKAGKALLGLRATPTPFEAKGQRRKNEYQ